ncbi:M23 family metallopeptidase [Sedimentitalea sp. JM2-8]|uniref:M23 family metallopeptidase n=1 Tax=Sedimentitalea xiamensis TaxID=3050037 RepID=A0ABT7FFH4_9RHOB|nr:M23 family metallopeptidase [Sedimentitalea xiamensis]MDK3073728.1 M23 family metallopeptidase [Sedimentitalea xiamensis]
MRAALAAVILSLAAPVAAGDFVLDLPIGCDLGETCHIQHFVDRDPGKGAMDFRCGHMTYDGHKGTDFALATLADMRRGVDILTAAPGVVTAQRDGMPDMAFDDGNAAQVEGRECGNGVVIEHEGGWETQYCHMKSGSIAVSEGDRLSAGAVLGQVGLSGKTTFPHLHLSVRREAAVIDPFDVDPAGNCGYNPLSIWRETPPYRAGGLIGAGFADGVPTYDAIRDGSVPETDLTRDSAVLVLFGFAYGGREGDEMRLILTGPEGEILSHAERLDRAQAQFFRAAGKRRPAAGWPAGPYEGLVILLRDDVELDRKPIRIRVD